MVCPLGVQSDMVWCSGITRRGTKALPGITPNQNRKESRTTWQLFRKLKVTYKLNSFQTLNPHNPI